MTNRAPAKKPRSSKAGAKPIHEPFLWKELTAQPVIGVDEVGRGCLAGPVFAAAVIVPFDCAIEGVTDSKLIAESRRDKIAQLIHDQANVGIGFASVGEIDRLNILNATFLAMRRAIEHLGTVVIGGHVLVDGNMRIRMLEGFMQTPLVKGDLRAMPIAAASIVAKVARDEYMRKLALSFPVYGFEKHKGYASQHHTDAIQTHGPCVHHRSTFAGVREHWNDQLDLERAGDPF